MDQLIKDTIEKDFKSFFNNVGKRKSYVGDFVAIKARKLKGCSLDINGPSPKFDMVPDPEYGIIKTKFKVFHENDHKVSIGTARDFDTLFIVALNKRKGIIENVYAIPEKELDMKRVITIAGTEDAYQKFKIDEKPYNEIYCYMKTGKYSVLEDGDITIGYTGR